MPEPLIDDAAAGSLAETDSQAGATRPARALLGWLPDQRAHQLLTAGRPDSQVSAEDAAALRAARSAVAARPPGVDQRDLLAPMPAELAEHEAALRIGADHLFAEGWELFMVDLSRVCALQPAVFTDHASQRTAGLTVDDLAGLAELTVPVRPLAPPQVSFGRAKNSWVMVSPSPNLHLVDQFSGPIDGAPPGTQGFGFLVGVLPSHVQVVELENRYYLRDGYHRSLGLLSAGITTVPAFVRSISDVEEMSPTGMLSQSAFAGPRPPLLPDYLSDEVAMAVRLPASQRVVIVQGIEMGAFSQP